ncbi:alanine racemase [Sulfitobacter undariae]|nr:alanine racemase [Sulfitobacter undariae]
MLDNFLTNDIVHASWCEVFPERIAQNLRLARGLLPEGAQFLAVLKADAYGHGISRVVPIIMEQGVNYVGITSNSEAKAVRAAGFTGTVMRVRTATSQEIEGAMPEQVQEQVSTLFTAQMIAGAARSGAKIAGVHLSLNARGMSRDGLEIATQEGRETCMEILDLIGPHIVGITSHFPSNTPVDLLESDRQFQDDVDWVFAHSRLQRTDIQVHAGSSLSLVSDHKVTTDIFRCGAILYGILKQELGFRSTMELKSRVTNITSYPKGSTTGYDRAIILQSDRQLANVSIGYSNGISRVFFGDSTVLIHGQRVPILGKISMNTITVDVTEIPDIAVGDEAVIFGRQGGACIDGPIMERQADTIMADLFADWGLRNQRIYIE